MAHVGEGGLLGIAVHPEFETNSFVYVYYTYESDENLANRVVRYRKEGEALVDEKSIIDDIPGARFHDGGRIKFGPDGHLYVTTGDSLATELSQDKKSLVGKILRLKDDGSLPPDNPVTGTYVYSFGHRNPQGLAWDGEGRLWSTEHGQSGTDELNLIEPGKNYGWPTARGDEKATGLESPMIHSGRGTWAPAGMAYFESSIYYTGLRGQSLYEFEIGDTELRRHLNKNFGRLRDVVVGPDNFLYILTSNRDGRAIPTSDDDLLIRINPEKLS